MTTIITKLIHIGANCVENSTTTQNLKNPTQILHIGGFTIKMEN